MEKELVRFLGYGGPGHIYATFDIKRGGFDELVVAYEGFWTDERAMEFHRHYKYYEDVQEALGTGLRFISKERSDVLNRSLFKFEIMESSCLLAVPACGEELYFEIYGCSKYDERLTLLFKKEF